MWLLFLLRLAKNQEMTKPESTQYDTAIVLGGGRDSSETLNLRTVSRLRKAIELFRADLFRSIILSGGISFSAPTGTIRSEASLMRDWLLNEGIPDSVMHLEESSTDTLGNAYFSKEQLLIPNVWRSIVVVTSAFHVERCKYLFQKVLGSNYKISFAECSDDISQEDAERLGRLESHIREVYASCWLNGVADGDSKAISNVLFEHHPGHAPNPDFTKEEFVKALYGDSAD
jgi:uncharacterized SAM-binding protein YcdF (DUF218 family)